ncbi:MAG: hypothetical protein QG553_389 [Patescibacteria group bacterium]|nr:hypothetical protein [Patescibacteria group bacterium]
MKLKKLDQTGSHLIAVSLVIVAIAVVGFAGYRVLGQKKDNNTNSQQPSKTTTESDLVLQNLGIDTLSNVDVTTQATREYQSRGLKGFYIFGEKLDDTRKNPNFEYASLKTGTKAVAAIDGTVTFVKLQNDSNDYEVMVQPKDGSAWTIGYDHLVKLTVKQGDTVKAGDPLGEPNVQNNGLLRFEVQINKDADGQTTHYCPSNLLAANVKDQLLTELKTMQNQWNTTTGYQLYDVSQQNPVGCLKTTMTPAEAEGR